MKRFCKHMAIVITAGLVTIVQLVDPGAAIASQAAPEPQPTAAGPGPKLFGTHGDHMWDVENSRIDSALEAEAAFGARISRNTLRWNVVEPARDVYDWSKADAVVNMARAHGQEVLFTAHAAPGWANGTDGQPEPPGSVGGGNTRIIPSDTTGFNQFKADYVDFMKDAVQHFRGRVKFYEVWNEPNEHYYWQPRGLSPTTNRARWIDMYKQLFQAARTGMRQVDSSIEIAVGAISGIGASCCILGTDFLKGLLDRNLVFDDLAINSHAIRQQAPWTTIQFAQNFSDIKLMRQILVNRGKSGVDLWLTEFGWQSGGMTGTGTTTSQLRIPANPDQLALWPNSGQVVVNGVTRNYSSITRNASQSGQPYNYVNLTSPLPSVPASGTEVHSPQAEAKHAEYVRTAIQMLRGKYVPQEGRPQQDYSYVEIAIWFANHDRRTVWFGFYGLFREPTPNWNVPGEWVLEPKPAAEAFESAISSK